MSQSASPTTSKIALIDERLERLVPGTDPLSEAMRYALLGPGKRIRPQLTLAATLSFGGTFEEALDPACAIEMIHAYSLVHDDLPCMDDDDERRGRPTLHRVFGEAIALLAGDALLTEAFGVLARAPLSPTLRIQLIDCLSQRSGKVGMALGQAIDLLKPQNRPAILDMHRKKTGDLLSCSLEFGAILAAPEKQTEMRRFGLHLGLAYQLRDDLEDQESLFNRKETEALMQESFRALKDLPPLIYELIEPLFKNS